MPPGRLLGTSWALLGACWPLLGTSGALLGPSWAPSGRSWASLGHMLALRDAPKLEFRMFWERPGWVWDPFRGRFGPAFCEQSPDLRHAHYSIPFNSVPFRSLPLILFHSIPFHTIPFHSIPLLAVPFHTVRFHFIAIHSTPFWGSGLPEFRSRMLPIY